MHRTLEPVRPAPARGAIGILERTVGRLRSLLQRAASGRANNEEVARAADSLQGELLWRLRDAHASRLSPGGA